jgi:hypothetical protein
VHTVKDMKTPIGELLQAAGSDGFLLQAQGESPFALIPLDDDLIDFMTERNPRLIDKCRQIRQRMQNGKVWIQQSVNELFGRRTT